MLCSALTVVLLFVHLGVKGSIDHLNIDGKGVMRKLKVLEFEIDRLRTALSTKELVMRDLNYCSGKTLTVSRDGEDYSSYPVLKLLKQLTELIEIEKSTYRNIRLSIQEIFPEQVALGGRGNSIQMILALQELFRNFNTRNVTTPRRNVSCETMNTRDGARHHLVSTHEVAYALNSSCSAPTYEMVLLPGGNYVLRFWNELQFCGQNNTLIRRKPQIREPYKVVYYKDTSVLVESFTERTKTIKEVNWSTGRTRLFTRSDGRESSGLSVYGQNVFVISKYTTLEVYRPQFYKRIWRGYPRRYWSNVYTNNAEPGSNYGLIRGEIVGHLPVLIDSSGMKVCSVSVPRLSSNGYVTKNGVMYIAAPGNNRIFIFDKECQLYEYLQLPPRHYVDEIVGIDDVILVTMDNVMFQYVRGNMTSPFFFNWE